MTRKLKKTRRCESHAHAKTELPNMLVKAAKESRLESLLHAHMHFVGIDFEREYRFHPTRKWRFDFAVPEVKVGIECEGLMNPKFKSRHTTNKGFEADCEKYNSAAMRGWAVLRFTYRQIKSGYAIGMIERTIERRMK